MSREKQSIVVGTRASLLARSQTAWVVERVKRAWPGCAVETVVIESSGDRIVDRPLYEFGGKGLFTKELEIALLEKRIDVAVHSLKDVPVTMPLVETEDLVFAAVPEREDVRDVLVMDLGNGVRNHSPERPEGCFAPMVPDPISQIPRGARVGTGSLRRRCQLSDVRGDLQVELIRGNVDTRIRKLKEGQYDAVILAMAGVKRAGLWDEGMMTAIPTETMLPAAGQAALAVQCRKADEKTRRMVAVLDDPTSHACVEVERMLVRELGGDCHSPIGAWAREEGSQKIVIEGVMGARDGGLPVKRGKVVAEMGKVEEAVRELAVRLR